MEQEKLQALLKQIEQWHDDNEFSLIIKAIDDLPADERTPELISQQARAYNNLAVMGDVSRLKRGSSGRFTRVSGFFTGVVISRHLLRLWP